MKRTTLGNYLDDEDPRADCDEAPCEMCERIGSGFGPRHDGSPNCESGSIASGGDRAHCTCDTCF